MDIKATPNSHRYDWEFGGKNGRAAYLSATQNVKGEIKKMIKVIKPRSRRNIECMNCGALLSYEKEDVKKAASKKFNETAFEFVNDYHDHIICPEYGEEIRLGAIR